MFNFVYNKNLYFTHLKRVIIVQKQPQNCFAKVEGTLDKKYRKQMVQEIWSRVDIKWSQVYIPRQCSKPWGKFGE